MKALSILTVSLLFWFLFYSQTLLSMAEIWWRSETFAHGMLIFPISLYLIWLKKDDFFLIEKKPSLFFLFCLLSLVIVWALAKAVDVQVVQQFMVILMLPFIIGSLFGFKMLKHYLFPLLYLLFAVPFGEFLIPKLQEYTAIMTIFGLQVTGIPVYSEGMFISIPKGDFEVAVACSGIRYLIASLALGTLYAYLTYTKLYKKLIFIAASVIVPILANGFRAYGIVMIAHLSDMKYATGADHLIYGWLFFGVVIFILFFVGSFWQDPIEQRANTQATIAIDNKPLSLKSALPIIILFLGPIMMYWMTYEPTLKNSTLLSPIASTPWTEQQTKVTEWQASFKNADNEVSTTYYNKENKVKIYYYSSAYQFEAQSKELISSTNEVFSTERWILAAKTVTLALDEYKVDELIVRNYSGKLLIWSWYEVLGLKLINPIQIKIVQAFGKLSGTSRGGQFKAIALPFYENTEQAKKQLHSFLKDNPQIINNNN